MVGTGGAGPEKRGAPCNSCDGYLSGTEPGWVCAECLRDWRDWHRAEREATARYVNRMMGEASRRHAQTRHSAPSEAEQ